MLEVAWTGDPPFAYMPESGPRFVPDELTTTVTESIFIHASQPFSYHAHFFCLSILLARRVPASQHRSRLIPRNHIIVRSTRLDEAHYWNSAYGARIKTYLLWGSRSLCFRIIPVFRHLMPARDSLFFFRMGLSLAEWYS
jgi:hypothetical protein